MHDVKKWTRCTKSEREKMWKHSPSFKVCYTYARFEKYLRAISCCILSRQEILPIKYTQENNNCNDYEQLTLNVPEKNLQKRVYTWENLWKKFFHGTVYSLLICFTHYCIVIAVIILLAEQNTFLPHYIPKIINTLNYWKYFNCFSVSI